MCVWRSTEKEKYLFEAADKTQKVMGLRIISNMQEVKEIWKGKGVKKRQSARGKGRGLRAKAQRTCVKGEFGGKIDV